MATRGLVYTPWIALLTCLSFGCARGDDGPVDSGSPPSDGTVMSDTGGVMDTRNAVDMGSARDNGSTGSDTGNDTGTLLVDGGTCTAGATRPCYDGPAGTRGVGVCHPGTNACVSGSWSTVCSGEQTPAAMEICGNGLDDDCNGMVDEGCAVCTAGATRACYDGPAGTQGVGVCHAGTNACVSGNWSTTCSGEQTPAAMEVCGNGLDDNCNGMVDEGCAVCTAGMTRPCYDGPAGTQGVGVCHAGANACVSGNWSTVCSGEQTPGAMEICGNGIDDNCNGMVDEGCATDACAVATDCLSCTGMAVCGWCANTNGCLTGTGSGPNSGACAGTDWSWLSSSCP